MNVIWLSFAEQAKLCDSRPKENVEGTKRPQKNKIEESLLEGI
jgi:hypothetical protein